jgi:hypothetical protein
MEANPTQGFEKLQFLLQQNPFPPETFGNLLLLYVKYQVSVKWILLVFELDVLLFAGTINCLFILHILVLRSCRRCTS